MALLRRLVLLLLLTGLPVASALLAFGGRRLSERAGRWLKLLSGAVMLALGAVMLLRPGWLE